MAAIAARISSGIETSDAWKACAVPSKCAVQRAGRAEAALQRRDRVDRLARATRPARD